MEMTRVAKMSFLAAVFFLLAAPSVLGAFTNVALRRPTSGSVRKSRSCTAGLCKSPNAVDGRYPKAVFNPNICYHSDFSNTPKLRINLGTPTTIKNVTLFSVISTKQSDMERFNGVQVFISNSKDFSTAKECGASQVYSFAKFGPAYPFTKTCSGTKMKYVFVAIPRREFLILCEVQVYGEPTSPAPPISPPPKAKSPPPPKKSPPPPPKISSPPPKISSPPPKISSPPPKISPPPPPPAEGPVSSPRTGLLELSEFDEPGNNDYGLLFPKNDIDY